MIDIACSFIYPSLFGLEERGCRFQFIPLFGIGLTYPLEYNSFAEDGKLFLYLIRNLRIIVPRIGAIYNFTADFAM